jgi:hypothetical protein
MAVALCLLGCGAEPSADVVLPVRLHTLPSCDVSSELVADHGKVELLALGDFAASNDSAEILALDAPAGTSLPFPPETRAVVARLDDPGQPFLGYAERGVAGYDVLLWPADRECSVFRPAGARGYPGKGAGQALGFSRRQQQVLVAGGNDALAADAIVGTLTFDVARGQLSSRQESQDSLLREARAFATATEFGAGLLVAGGEYPVDGVAELDLEPRRSAEVFDPARSSFVGEPIELTPRTRHDAVALRGGSTLLVGGRSQFGDSNVELRVSELVSPQTRRAKPAATLAAGRIEPTALLLSDGRVLVGGGYTLSGRLARPAAEWLSPDGEQNLRVPTVLLARYDQAFVATPGGGVLAVGGCEEVEGELTEQQSKQCRAVCRRGCPPHDAAGNDAYDAWWLDAQGQPSEVTLTGIAAPQPLLLPGSDGSPWLVAALTSEPGTPRLFRFNPWTRRFSLADVPAGLRLPRPGLPRPLAIDTDAFVWVDDGDEHGELLGLRLGTRNRYAQDLALVLLSDPLEPTRPLHLVPSRPLRGDEAYDGQLRLQPSDDDPLTVYVADADFADFVANVQLAELGPDSVPPRIVLGNVEVGGAGCAWPEGTRPGGSTGEAELRRRGSELELRYGGRARSCAGPEGRVSLGLRAGASSSVVTELRVVRGAR